ncbi:hypothetical protein DL769_010119 [Monosporascus sp. CRB-8-3]|nr:hypothetical protein DL769_010119 [Monosporascus sp. CRB-8-3]
MVWGWQLWLSPRPLRRTPTSSEPHILGAHDAVLFEFLEEDGRMVIKETHYADKKIVRDGLSGPPLYLRAPGKDWELPSPPPPEASEQFVDQSYRHRFWAHASNKEDLIFKVWAQPQGLDRGFDEKFIRNLIGYQRDCQRANLTPSIFQLILFGYGSATVGTPPFWVPLWILNLVHYVLAIWIAAALLGYKDSYPEYSPNSDGYSYNIKKSS